MPAESSQPANQEAAAVPEPEGVPEPADLVPDPIQVPPGQTVHFPTPQPRLTQGGQKVLNALRPAR
jgi:hypothetical protein